VPFLFFSFKAGTSTCYRREQIVAELDPHNEGVLIVHLDGARGGETIGPDEISRRLAQDDKGCIIM